MKRLLIITLCIFATANKISAGAFSTDTIIKGSLALTFSSIACYKASRIHDAFETKNNLRQIAIGAGLPIISSIACGTLGRILTLTGNRDGHVWVTDNGIIYGGASCLGILAPALSIPFTESAISLGTSISYTLMSLFPTQTDHLTRILHYNPLTDSIVAAARYVLIHVLGMHVLHNNAI